MQPRGSECLPHPPVFCRRGCSGNRGGYWQHLTWAASRAGQYMAGAICVKLKALSASTVQSVTSQKISCLAGAAPWMDEGMIRVGNRVEAWILCMSSQHMFLCNNCDLDTQRIDFEDSSLRSVNVLNTMHSLQRAACVNPTHELRHHNTGGRLQLVRYWQKLSVQISSYPALSAAARLNSEPQQTASRYLPASMSVHAPKCISQ